MPLVRMKELLLDAKRNKYAVGAFNPYNIESAQAIIAAAEIEKSPVILQIWSGFDTFIGIDVLAGACIAMAKKSSVPVVVHLDHGETLEHIGKAVRAGLTSVMIDGSSLPLQENIAITKNTIAIVRSLGIDVEGEIGHVGNSEMGDVKNDSVISSFKEAAEYYEQTKVDSLAISIGSAHGVYEEQPVLNINLLKKVAETIPIPLVLHGGSYIPEDQILMAIENGISKINIATELGNCFIKAMVDNKDKIANAHFSNEVTSLAYDAMREHAQKKMRLFKSEGKA